MISVQLVRALQHEVRRRFKAGQEMRNDNADLSSQSRFCTVLDKASANRSMTRATGRVSKNWRVERGHPLLDLAISSPATRPQVAGIIAVATRLEQVEQNVAAARWLLNPGELAEVDPMTADT